MTETYTAKRYTTPSHARVLAMYGEWACGPEAPEDVAADWLAALPGLTAEGLAAWLEADVWSCEAAARLMAAGIAAEDLPAGVGDLYSAGCLTLDEVRERI